MVNPQLEVLRGDAGGFGQLGSAASRGGGLDQTLAGAHPRFAQLGRLFVIDSRNLIDPSHQLPVFQGGELLEFIEGASLYIANDYEWALTQDQSGCSEAELLERVEAAVVTRGAEGSWIFHRGRATCH